MDRQTLKGTGTRISKVSLGTMTFGGQVNESDSISIIHKAIDSGVNFIDTADVYNGGITEKVVGKALKWKRDSIVLASKIRWRLGTSDKDQGLSKWHIINGVENCLKRLETDYLDICYLHAPDYNTPLEESLEAMDYLVKQGKVMYVGMSNYAAWQVCQAKWICDKRNYAQPVVTQTVYNMITRGIEQEYLPFSRSLKVGVTVYNPLASGMLTGKYNKEKAPEKGTRLDYNKEHYNRYWKDSNFSALNELCSIADNAGMKPAELALRWLISQKDIDSVVIGVSCMEQLDENIKACENVLGKDVLEACDKVWDKIKGESFQYNR